MIRHSIQLLEWLGGVGATKSRVLPDETQFEENVRLTFDLSNAPGSPMGANTTAACVLNQNLLAADQPVCAFRGPPGGAVLRKFRFSPTTVTALGGDVLCTFNNFNFTPRITTANLRGQNVGGRQFDDTSDVPSSGNVRRIIPFGQVSLMVASPALVAAPIVSGAERRATFAIFDSSYTEANLYIPPGDSGYGCIIGGALAANATIRGEFLFDLFPLQSTGLPK